ncbi:hypothetical protein F5Y16DRAFT_408219 [Xylariaceae sp. FL0255]|nr:hypothetical protein F5Y16DRAFT_408219 [Xylariaceae sp. FL0255]
MPRWSTKGRVHTSRKVRVISAGFSRTGTVTMAMAVGKLLEGPVLHGGSQIFVRDDVYFRMANDMAEGIEARRKGNKEKTLKLVRTATAGFDAVADAPPNDFIPELVELYPDSKVILVKRDPEKWWKSISAVMAMAAPWWLSIVMAPIPGWRHVPALGDEYSREFMALAGMEPGEGTVADLARRGGPHMLQAYMDMVRSAVPKDRLLEFELSQGWEPLCKFLNVPVPNEPFPRANDAAAAEEYGKKVFLKIALVWLGIFSSIGITIYGGFWLWKTQL